MEHELLKPRVKVISPMALMRSRVGSLLNCHEVDGDFTFGVKSVDNVEHFYPLQDFKEWSCIFKILEWWQDRDEKDMPQYVRVIKDVFHPKEVPYVAKVNSIINKLPYLVGFMLTDAGDGCYTHWKNLEPITETDYIAHHQTPSNDNSTT